MHDLDAAEVRVLGCLVEKQRTTPDQYPLSLNALRLACNQVTNREPVVDYDEATLRAAVERLSRRGWVRLASGPGGRVAKYRHLLDDALGRVPSQLALLAVLMLRGPQTPGELKQRVDRLYPYGSIDDVQSALDALAGAELVECLPRRPGQSQQRWRQLLGGDDGEPASTPGEARPAGADTLEERVAQLERDVAVLQELLSEVRDGADPGESVRMSKVKQTTHGAVRGVKGKVARTVEGPIAKRTPLSVDTIRSLFGALFLFLSIRHLVNSLRAGLR